MSVRARLSSAWNGLRGKTPTAKARGGNGQRLWPDRYDGLPQWSMIGLDSYINKGFQQNSIVNSAVMYKVRAARTAPLRAYVGTLDTPELAPRDHPLAMLCARPNPDMSADEFHDLNTVFFNLAGSVYIYLERPNENALPTAMYTFRPDRMRIIPDKGNRIKGYVYIPEGGNIQDAIPILPADMMHVKNPNPGDKLGGLGDGLSPLKASAQSIDVDNSVTAYLKRFFERGTMFQGILKLNMPLDDAQIARLKERWKQQYGGVENWDEIGILDQFGEYQRISPTFDEMGFESIDERNETRTLGPLGVPPILIGARVGLKHATYANFEAARKLFWEDTFWPDLLIFEHEYQYYLVSDDGAFVMFDLSRVPALRKDIPKLTRAALDLWNAGVPIEIACKTVGLPMMAFPGSLVSYISGQPVGQAPAADSSQVGDNADATADQRAAAGPRRFKSYDPDQMATKMDSIATSWEDDFGAEAEHQFELDQREILALLNENQKASRQNKASIDWRKFEQDVRDYLKKQGEDRWREAFVPLIEGVIVDGGEEWAAALGIQFDVRNLQGELWFQDYTLVFAQPINDTTSDAIHTMVEQALAEGWSIKEYEDRLDTLFKQWMQGNLSPEDFAWFKDRLPPYRRELIARVESMRAENAGIYNLSKGWGVEKKEWLHTPDNRVRDSHKTAGFQYRQGGTPGPIPIDEFFIVGGYNMLYPLDMSNGAPADEAMNCRCAFAPSVDEKE